MGHAHHYLSRLDRLENPTHLELAKQLYNHPELVRLVVRRAGTIEEDSRLAISLAHPTEGPWAILTSDGKFVTCLGPGMRPRPDHVKVTPQVLFDAMREHHDLHALGWVVNCGIVPQTAQISRAHDNGEVALVFLAIAPSVSRAAGCLGWRGGYRECMSMNRTRAERFARALPPDDIQASAWLRGRRPGRVFVCADRGNYCVNWSPEHGYSIEPGTTNRERGITYDPDAA